MYFSFLSFTFTSCILVLWPFDIHCTYIWFISIDVCYSPIFTCVVSFLSLCTWFLYIVCNLLFLFQIKMDEFCLKCFRNTGCQSLLAIHSLLANFCMSWVIYDFSLICSFVCCGFVMDCQRGRLLGYMWFNVRNICQYRIG